MGGKSEGETSMWNKFREFCSDLSPIFFVIALWVVIVVGNLSYATYNFYKGEWEKQARLDRYEAIKAEEAAAEKAAEKAAALAEVQSFVDGDRSYDDLSENVKEMLLAAEAKEQQYDLEMHTATVYPELFEIVPAFVRKEAQTPKLTPFTREEFERRCRAYQQALPPDEHDFQFGDYLRINSKELMHLNRMWRSMNDERQRIVDEKMKDLPLLADGVLSARYVDSLSGGQSFLAANVEGFDPNKEHSTFSDAVVSVFNAGGHTFAAGNDAGVIQLPQALDKKETNEVFNWDGCVSPKETRQSISFGGVGLSAPIFTETSGTLVAFQIGKEHLRVTFVEKKGVDVKPDAALYEALRELAELIGIDFPSDTSPTWVKNEKDSTTWDYNVGGR